MKHNRTIPPGYEVKFQSFIKLCEKAKADQLECLVVAEPWMIGDNYDEVMESLARVAEVGLALRIATPLDNH